VPAENEKNGSATRPADTFAHAKAALQRHHFLDFVVQAFSPLIPFFWRRASTFCKALEKIQLQGLFGQQSLCWLTSCGASILRGFSTRFGRRCQQGQFSTPLVQHPPMNTQPSTRYDVLAMLIALQSTNVSNKSESAFRSKKLNRLKTWIGTELAQYSSIVNLAAIRWSEHPSLAFSQCCFYDFLS